MSAELVTFRYEGEGYNDRDQASALSVLAYNVFSHPDLSPVERIVNIRELGTTPGGSAEWFRRACRCAAAILEMQRAIHEGGRS